MLTQELDVEDWALFCQSQQSQLSFPFHLNKKTIQWRKQI